LVINASNIYVYELNLEILADCFFNILLPFHIIHWMYLMVDLLDGEAAAEISEGEDPNA
jgi:hypothetical protein